LNACGHGFDGKRFCQARDALEQEMTVGEQSSIRRLPNTSVHNNVSDLLAERRNPLAELAHFLRNFLGRFHTVW